MKILEQALKYLALGWSVVPAHKDSKHPIVNWSEFQKRRATEAELREWFKDDQYNIGIVTGRISNLVVIDIDKGTDIEKLNSYFPLPASPVVETGGGGSHHFYEYPKDRVVSTKARIFGQDSPWKVDVRATGGFIVTAPSTHAETKLPYGWRGDLRTPGILSDKWLEALSRGTSESDEKIVKAWETSLDGSNEGTRDDDMTSFVGLLMRTNHVKVWDTVIPAAMKEKNKTNTPFLAEADLKKVYFSIRKKELARRAGAGEVDEEDAPEKTRNAPKSIKELYDQDIPPTLWLVDKLIPINSITVLAATSGSFKTWLLMEIALRVAAKQKVFEEFEVLKDEFGILIVDEENWEGIIQTRLKLMVEEALIPDLAKLPIYFYNLELLKIINEKDVAHILKVCKEKNIKFVIFDSLNRIHNSDENSATEMNKVFNQMKKLQKEGLTVLFTHHNRKQGIFKPTDPAENMRGSGDIRASVDCQLAVEVKILDEVKTLVMHQFKARAQEELESFKIKILKDDNYLHFKHDGAYDVTDDKNSKIGHYKQELVAYVQNNPGVTSTEIISAFEKKLNAKYVREALNQLERDMVFKAEGKRPKKYLIYPRLAEEIDVEEALEKGEADSQQLLEYND